MSGITNNLKADVIIIDSGIDTNNINLRDNIAGGISFNYDSNSNLVTFDPEYHDENGHGTNCASIIKRLAPDASMYILKVLNKDAKTNSKVLIESLKHLTNLDARVINISLATIEDEFAEELKDTCSLLYRKGKILICSLDNRENRSYPAIFDNVIGVRGSNFNLSNEFWYNAKFEIQCVADGLPVLVSGLNSSYSMFGGNSKATAMLTGIVLEILNKQPDLEFSELNKLLEKEAKRNEWSEKDISREFNSFGELDRPNKEYPQIKLKKLESIIREELGLKKDIVPLIYKNRLYHPKIGVNKLNCYFIIKRIENEFNLSLDYGLISLNTFESIYTLLDFVLEGEKWQRI